MTNQYRYTLKGMERADIPGVFDGSGELYVRASDYERMRSHWEEACKQIGKPTLEPKCEPFVVKHYTSDERPSIKGNGFDGLEVGTDREDAEDFVRWLNERLGVNREAPNE